MNRKMDIQLLIILKEKIFQLKLIIPEEVIIIILHKIVEKNKVKND